MALTVCLSVLKVGAIAEVRSLRNHPRAAQRESTAVQHANSPYDGHGIGQRLHAFGLLFMAQKAVRGHDFLQYLVGTADMQFKVCRYQCRLVGEGVLL